MDFKTVEQFKVVGISVRTSNENGQAGRDLPELWARFFSESVQNQIPNKIDASIYCVYTEYEKDHTRPYTAILGCKVDRLDQIPEGMLSVNIPNSQYKKYTAKGNLSKGAVFNQWLKIWEDDIKRTFEADFEVYGEGAQDPEHAEIDIFVGIQ